MLYNRYMKLRFAFIIGVSLVVGLLGAGISRILPNQYTAKGLLVVMRRADEPSKEVFTYEGSYAQQNAGAYTGTLLAILQSPANLASAKTGIDVKQLSRLAKAKRDGTQAIAFSVKGDSEGQAKKLWTKITDSAVKTHEVLKPTADPLIFVTITPESPVVLKTYPAWQTVFGAGFAFSAVILSTLIMIIRYLKEGNDY